MTAIQLACVLTQIARRRSQSGSNRLRWEFLQSRLSTRTSGWTLDEKFSERQTPGCSRRRRIPPLIVRTEIAPPPPCPSFPWNAREPGSVSVEVTGKSE
jgi:hypothetical protein